MLNKQCPDAKVLADYGLGKLAIQDLDPIEDHIEECVTCQQTLDRLDHRADTFIGGLRQAPAPIPHQEEKALQAALKSVNKPPQTGQFAETLFDPYHQWLGVPAAEQPPHHYRLLGLALFEGNANAIENAADRQMAHIRTLQAGKHSAHANRILNEIAKARICLLNPDQKQKYDAELRARAPQAKLPVAKRLPDSPAAGWVSGQAPRTIEDFLRCLAASKLMDAGAASQFLQSLPLPERPTDAKACASVFVSKGKLTAYQARAIYQGKPHGLLIADREILDLIGKGGMGNVYKVRYRRLDRIEAMKLIAPQKLDSADAKLRFQREARAAARLNHPNVVATYDAGEAGNVHFLTMEYVEGCDLAQMVKERGPMTMEHAIGCILQAAAGLEAAHAKEIIHRDIKPHNLLLDRNGKVKVLDMGLARFTDTHESLKSQQGLTQSGQVMGTVDYMSPEQSLDTHNVGPASDVYSLGCTLHYLLTGKTPFQAESLGAKMMAHHNHPIPSLCAARSDVSPALDAVFQRMMAKKPAERLGTMAEVIAALQSLISAEAPVPPPVSKPPADDSKLDVFLSQIVVSKDLPAVRGATVQRDLTAAPARSPTARRKQRPPWLLIGTGLAALIAILAAVVVLSIKTPNGEVIVELDEGVADDVSVILSSGGKQVDVIDKNDQWKVSLAEGRYEVQFKGDAEKFQIDKNSVTISRDYKQIVRISLRSMPPLGAGTPDKDGWTDLLATIDPNQHAVQGRWHRSGNDVFPIQVGQGQRIYSPLEVKGGYDLECEFTVTEGTDCGIIIPVANSLVFLNLWHTNGTKSQIKYGFPSGACEVNPAPLRYNERKKLAAKVRVIAAEAEITVTVTDHPLLVYRGPVSRLTFTQEAFWQLPKSNCVAVISHGTLVTYHTLRVKPDQTPLPRPDDGKVYAVTGDTLETGKWFNVLDLVDVDKHILDGLAKRDANGVHLLHGPSRRVILPIQVAGDYQLEFSFTRVSGSNDILIHFPVARHANAGIMLSGWDGGAGGIHAIDGKGNIDGSRSEGVVRPSRLQNGRRYSARLNVSAVGDQVQLDFQLDGQPYISWQGDPARLEAHVAEALPRTDLICFGTSDLNAILHEVKLRPLSNVAKVWKPEVDQTAAEPPESIKAECVQWNGHWYWVNSIRAKRPAAIALAEKYGGRLLEISSVAEHKFITSQFPGFEFWLAAWRSGKDVNARTYWLNDRLQPLTYFGPWAFENPQARPDESYLAIATFGHGEWHDYGWNANLHTCVEWGDEATQDKGDVPSTVVPRRAPPELTLKTNGLGGKESITPLVWPSEWVQAGVFAHVRGPGQIVYPSLIGYSYAMELDVTMNAHPAILSFKLGDRDDANVWLPVWGEDRNNTQRGRICIWNWLNEGRWRWGETGYILGSRLKLSLLVNESQYALVHDGRVVLRGHGYPADAGLLIEADQTTDAIIHSCQLRPLTDADITLLKPWGWRKPPDAVLKLDANSTRTRWEEQNKGLASSPDQGKAFIAPTTRTALTWIDPGEFQMGRVDEGQPRRHPVRLTRGFWIGKYELTQGEWQKLMPMNPSRITGSPYLPVDSVSYDDALKFCAALTETERTARRIPVNYEYRLPTDAEWEYACRAGTTTDFAVPKEKFWWYETADWRPHEVGESQPNAWGIFDMHGNAPEWCLDAWYDFPESGSLRVDPFVAPQVWRQRRVVRPGSWVWWGPGASESWDRHSHYPVAGGYRGFRVVLGPVLTDKISATALDPFVEVQPLSPANSETVDILESLRIPEDIVHGAWRIVDERLTCGVADFTRIGSGYRPLGAYKTITTLRWPGDIVEVNLLFPVATRDCCLRLREREILLLDVPGSRNVMLAPPEAFKRDTDYTVQTTVSFTEQDAILQVTVNGKAVLNWSGPFDWLGVPSAWAIPNHTLGIGSHVSSVQVTAWELQAQAGTPGRVRYQRGSPLPLNQWLNLHELSDLNLSQRFGQWQVGKQELTSRRTDEFARIVCPVEIDGEYEFRVIVERTNDWSEISFLLPFGRGRGLASFQPGKVFLQKMIGPQSEFTATLPVKSEVLWRVSPQGNSVTVEGEIDGKQVYRWSGDQSSIAMRHDWPITPFQLGVGVHVSDVVFRNAELRLLSGTGRRLDLATDSAISR
jgi:serine/threonine protein kinase/formylglycine-generating enzyme required for sulfatase activity